MNTKAALILGSSLVAAAIILATAMRSAPPANAPNQEKPSHSATDKSPVEDAVAPSMPQHDRDGHEPVTLGELQTGKWTADILGGGWLRFDADKRVFTGIGDGNGTEIGTYTYDGNTITITNFFGGQHAKGRVTWHKRPKLIKAPFEAGLICVYERIS